MVKEIARYGGAQVPLASNLIHHRATSMSHDARYPEGAEVVYVLHPLHGQHVAVLRVERNLPLVQALVQTPHGAQFLPCWMTDPHLCRQLTQSDSPCCSLSALRELDALLASLDGKAAPRSQHS
jgi:hypothetical protein